MQQCSGLNKVGTPLRTTAQPRPQTTILVEKVAKGVLLLREKVSRRLSELPRTVRQDDHVEVTMRPTMPLIDVGREIMTMVLAGQIAGTKREPYILQLCVSASQGVARGKFPHHFGRTYLILPFSVTSTSDTPVDDCRIQLLPHRFASTCPDNRWKIATKVVQYKTMQRNKATTQ